MKKLTIRVFAFGILLLVLNQIPNLFLSPYHGNQIYPEKHKYFSENFESFNSIVMGSMKLYRQLDPKLLDKRLQDYQLSTFNMAAPTTDNPEVFYLYEKLLEKNDQYQIQYVLMELKPLNSILQNNLSSPRNYYWHDFAYLQYAINYILDSSDKLPQKVYSIYQYCISYFNKLVNLYGYQALMLAEKPLSLGREKDGFYALDNEMVDIGGDNFLTNRLSRFKREGEPHLQQRIININNDLSLNNYEAYFNPSFFNKLIKLIEKSKENGVHLFFVMPPRSEKNLEVLAVQNKLPANHLIDLLDPQQFPNLYHAETSFDVNHLNEKGALLFTEYIADAMVKKVFSNKNQVASVSEKHSP